MAITWRNVDGGQGALAAGRLMQGAEQSFNSGFSGLQDVLKQYQNQEKANWDSGKEQNTQAALDRLSEVRTPEEMEALQASGQLRQELTKYGAQIDRSTVRNALDTRGDFLRQQATNRMTYDNQSRDQREAEAIDNIKALYARGDFEGGDRLAAGTDFRNDAAIQDLRTQSQFRFNQEGRAESAESRANVQSAQQTKRFGWEEAAQQRTEEELAVQRRIDRLALESAQVVAAQEQQNWQAIQDVAARSGLPLGQDGLPVFDPEKPAQKEEFLRLLELQGVAPNNPTAQVNQAVGSFLSEGIPGVSPKHVTQLRQEMHELMSTANDLSPEDKARLEASGATLTEQFNTRLAELDQKHSRERETNPYLDVPVNVEEGVLDVLTALPEDFDPVGINSRQREWLADSVEKQLRNGVPVSVAKLIVSKVGDSVGLTSDIHEYFDSAIEELEKSGAMKKGMEEAEVLSRKQEAERLGVTQELTQNLEKLKKAARSSAGISPARSADYLKGLTTYGKGK